MVRIRSAEAVTRRGRAVPVKERIRHHFPGGGKSTRSRHIVIEVLICVTLHPQSHRDACSHSPIVLIGNRNNLAILQQLPRRCGRRIVRAVDRHNRPINCSGSSVKDIARGAGIFFIEIRLIGKGAPADVSNRRAVRIVDPDLPLRGLIYPGAVRHMPRQRVDRRQPPRDVLRHTVRDVQRVGILTRALERKILLRAGNKVFIRVQLNIGQGIRKDKLVSRSRFLTPVLVIHVKIILRIAQAGVSRRFRPREEMYTGQRSAVSVCQDVVQHGLCDNDSAKPRPTLKIIGIPQYCHRRLSEASGAGPGRQRP